MKKEIKILIITLFFLNIFSNHINAQAIQIKGELRTRSEMRDGFQKPIGSHDSSAFVTNFRTRLFLTYTSNSLKTKITIQDTRTAGQTPYNKAGSSNTSVYEAWGEYLISPGFSATLGRQALEYDDKRIFSAANWSNTGNSHDALLLKYNSPEITAHFGTAWNNLNDENTEKSVLLYSNKQYYKTLNFIWLTKSMGDFGSSAIWVNEGFQKDTLSKNGNLLKNNYRNTIGGNIWMNGAKIPMKVYLTGYYQFGHQYNLKNKVTQSIDAFMLAGKLQGDVHKKLTLTTGEDIYSGSSTTLAKTETNTFNKLYGVNHSFNGFMEYWTTAPNSGLSDLYFGMCLKPTSKFKTDITWHKFNYMKKPKAGNKDLGSELDITLNYEVSPEISMQGGYCTYFLTDAVKLAKSTGGYKTFEKHSQQWAYVMVAFKPTFLNAK